MHCDRLAVVRPVQDLRASLRTLGVCVGHFATQRALHLPRVGRGRRARPRFDVCRGGSRAVRFARAPLRD